MKLKSKPTQGQAVVPNQGGGPAYSQCQEGLGEVIVCLRNYGGQQKAQPDACSPEEHSITKKTLVRKVLALF